MTIQPNFKTATQDRARLGRSLLLLLASLLVALPALAQIWPVRVSPASAPAEKFSAERAMAHLPIIAREAHPQGSPAQARVRDHLVSQLTEMGLEVEIQSAYGAENVVARLHGSAPSGAIVILAHYDARIGSAGAGDNGSGVVALLEIARAMSAGPQPQNDMIFLFDDGEELPDAFTGSRAFVMEHPWMADVRVAISLDSAVSGPISTNEVGPRNNGWLVGVLAEAHTEGAWTSFSGGGEYDSKPFSNAGLPVLALEDNYPFWQKHTPEDLPGIVRPASVQQMGEQTLAIARVLGERDLADPWGEQETFFTIPYLALVHYPAAWSLGLAIAGGVLLLIAFGLALARKIVSWRGLLISLGFILLSAILAAGAVSALMPKLPAIFGWKTSAWPEWPEVIPPNGWVAVLIFDLATLLLAWLGYRVARRWVGRADYSLAGLLVFLIPALLLAATNPKTAYPFLWTVLIGALGWCAAAAAGRKQLRWSLDLATFLAALPLLGLLLPFVPGVVMADGMKSLNLLVGFEALILAVTLPVVDGLVVSRRAKKE